MMTFQMIIVRCFARLKELQAVPENQNRYKVESPSLFTTDEESYMSVKQRSRSVQPQAYGLDYLLGASDSITRRNGILQDGENLPKE